jgi:hypothetical protein
MCGSNTRRPAQNQIPSGKPPDSCPQGGSSYLLLCGFFLVYDMKKIVVGLLEFSSKKDCIQYFKRMLHSYKPGDMLSDDDATEFLWLLRRHPERLEKIGRGLRSIRVDRHPVFTSQKCFTICRVDGSTTDVSYLTCIEGEEKPVKARWIEAMRNEVAGQIIRFKQETFGDEKWVCCELTGVPVDWQTCHVDHIRPFQDIAREFIESNAELVTAEALEPPADNQYQERFRDESIAGAWAAFHEAHAKLRIVSVTANLSRPRK